MTASTRGSRTSSRTDGQNQLQVNNLTVKDAPLVEIKSGLARIDQSIFTGQQKQNLTSQMLNIDRLVISEEEYKNSYNDQSICNDAIQKLNELSRENRTLQFSNSFSHTKYEKESTISYLMDDRHYAFNKNVIGSETPKTKYSSKGNVCDFVDRYPHYQEIELKIQNEGDDYEQSGSDEVRNYISSESSLNRNVKTLIDYPALTKAFLSEGLDDNNLIEIDSGSKLKHVTNNFSQHMNAETLKKMLSPKIEPPNINNLAFVPSNSNRINIYDDNLNMKTQVLNNLLKKI